MVAAMALIALLTLRGEIYFAYWALGIAAACVALPLALAADRRETTGAEAALWLQKPVREVPFLLARFAETIGATVGLTILFVTAALVAGKLWGWETARPLLLIVPAAALASFMVASMAFGCAAWLPRGSRTAVVGLILLGLIVFDPEMNQPELIRGGPILLARLVLFPLPDFLRFALGLTGDRPFELGPLLWSLAYAGGWMVIGVLGIVRTAATGKLARED